MQLNVWDELERQSIEKETGKEAILSKHMIKT
jgi:hypothetical protein